MKKIILDHFRRWWWILATGAAIQMIVFWFSTTASETPSDFLFFPYALFLGAFPLSFDLQCGHARAVLALPITVRQTARAWWLAAVCIPAIALTLTAIFSAGISCLVNTAGKFHADWLAINCVLNFLWLGASFFILTGLNNSPAANWWEQTRNIFFGALWGLSFGSGFIFCQHIATEVFKQNIVLTVGAIMSIAGWFRAEQLVLQRAGFRPFSKRPAQKRSFKISKGFGGIPFLATTMLARILLMWLAMLAFMALFAVLQGQTASPIKFLKAIIPLTTNGFPFWFVIVLQSFPLLLQLRYLRTLPLSTTKLAIVLVGLPMLSTFIFVVTSTALAIPVIGAEKAFATMQNFVLPAAFITWCIPLAVWQGFNRQTTYLIMFVLFLGAVIPLQFVRSGTLSLFWTAPVSALLIVVACLLTKRQLVKSSNAYRAWPNPMAGSWNWGR